jgi:hypothetical protein
MNNELQVKPEDKPIDPFIVTNSEFELLHKQFSDLAYFASWQLMRKNVKNNHTEDIEDIMQQLLMSIIRAGRYYKRQVYIEACLAVVEICLGVDAEHGEGDKFLQNVVEELKELWLNKTKHGANKQKFGPHQEQLLDQIVLKCVPIELRPDPKAPLRMDKKFHTYCKAIAWNQQKSMGRKISRERAVRSGQVSLSEFDYLGACMDNV